MIVNPDVIAENPHPHLCHSVLQELDLTVANGTRCILRNAEQICFLQMFKKCKSICFPGIVGVSIVERVAVNIPVSFKQLQYYFSYEARCRDFQNRFILYICKFFIVLPKCKCALCICITYPHGSVLYLDLLLVL